MESRTTYLIGTDRFNRERQRDSSECRNFNHYRGGTFRGIELNLNYIQQLGFAAIWISPVVKNYPGSYHEADFYIN